MGKSIQIRKKNPRRWLNENERLRKDKHENTVYSPKSTFDCIFAIIKLSWIGTISRCICETLKFSWDIFLFGFSLKFRFFWSINRLSMKRFGIDHFHISIHCCALCVLQYVKSLGFTKPKHTFRYQNSQISLKINIILHPVEYSFRLNSVVSAICCCKFNGRKKIKMLCSQFFIEIIAF